MKGLYVYGALLMTFSFVIGVLHSPTLMIFALASCALAALAEAIHEVSLDFNVWLTGTITAVCSWSATAFTALYALFIMWGVQ